MGICPGGYVRIQNDRSTPLLTHHFTLFVAFCGTCCVNVNKERPTSAVYIAQSCDFSEIQSVHKFTGSPRGVEHYMTVGCVKSAILNPLRHHISETVNGMPSIPSGS